MSGKILKKLYQCGSLLCRGRFFELIRGISAALVPSRIFGLKKSVFYRIPMQEKPKDSAPVSGGVRRGDEESVRQLVRDLYENDSKALDFHLDFYRNGVEPWIVRRDDRIVGVVWLFTGSYLSPWGGYDGWLLNVAVEPDAKFVANVFVDPQQRGRGLFPVIARRCFAAYPESVFYSCVDESNMASIKSHEKIGFRRCGVAWYVRFFQTTRCLFSPDQGRFRILKMKRGVPVDVSLVPCKPD